MTEVSALNGRRVLLVEDESLVSLLAEDVLAEAGCVVLLAMRLAEAMELARSAEFDLAVLDINLGGGQTSYPVAEVLKARGKPFVFASGYSVEGFDPSFADQPSVQKPYSPKDLLSVAARALAGG